ncbi:MAG: hypothetical protein K2G93_08785 [Rikenella sp.]|nr:hypothetical protein [Rikenella sp.]
MKKVRTVLLGSLLQSDDRQCAVMFEDIDVFQFYGDPKLSSIVPGLYTQQNLKHRNHILSILRARLDRWEVDPDAFLSIVSGREARRRFGADSIFTFEVPIEPQELAGETYTRCIHQVLSRRDRAYLGFVWFFTDEGYERRAEYLSALEGAAYYKRGRWRKPEWIRRPKEN